jgi:hypothetical protein
MRRKAFNGTPPHMRRKVFIGSSPAYAPKSIHWHPRHTRRKALNTETSAERVGEGVQDSL